MKKKNEDRKKLFVNVGSFFFLKIKVKKTKSDVFIFFFGEKGRKKTLINMSIIEIFTGASS